MMGARGLPVVLFFIGTLGCHPAHTRLAYLKNGQVIVGPLGNFQYMCLRLLEAERPGPCPIGKVCRPAACRQTHLSANHVVERNGHTVLEDDKTVRHVCMAKGEKHFESTCEKYTGVASWGNIISKLGDGSIRPAVTLQCRGGVAHGKYKSRHPMGELKLTGDVANNRAVGVWHEYYPSGSIKKEETCRNDLKHGKLTFWGLSGVKTREAHFRDGVPHGSWTERWDHPHTDPAISTKKTHGQYDHGRRVGTWKGWWWDSGQLMWSGQYRDGRRVGKWRWFHRNEKPDIAGQYTASAETLQGDNGYWESTDGDESLDISSRTGKWTVSLR